jgi:hypothetical protein
MRATRQRQKNGGVLVTIDLDVASIARLTALRWLEVESNGLDNGRPRMAERLMRRASAFGRKVT